MKKLILILLTMGILPSCASIMRDNSQPVRINSSAEKTNIEITDSSGFVVLKGQTPLVANLKASKGGYFSPEKYTITATKEGYQPQTSQIDWHVSNWYALGNLVFGGLIGYLVVDPITGDMYYLDDYAHLNMTPVE